MEPSEPSPAVRRPVTVIDFSMPYDAYRRSRGYKKTNSMREHVLGYKETLTSYVKKHGKVDVCYEAGGLDLVVDSFLGTERFPHDDRHTVQLTNDILGAALDAGNFQFVVPVRQRDAMTPTEAISFGSLLDHRCTVRVECFLPREAIEMHPDKVARLLRGAAGTANLEIVAMLKA